MKQKVHLKPNFLNRWIVVKAEDLSLAWSGSRWVLTDPVGFPIGGVQISNLDTYSEAKEYAESFGFEVIERYDPPSAVVK